MRDAPGQRFYPYPVWEDWKAGMYGSKHRPDVVDASMQLLASPQLFEQVLREVTEQWTYASGHNLSNVWKNHQPWCGRASCSYEHGATIPETNQAWWELTPTERLAANTVADRVTFEWRSLHMPGQLTWRM